MCIGRPMQVLACDEQMALCELDGEREQVDITLVGQQPIGTWLLVFLGAAREVMDAVAARHTISAIQALEAVAEGETQLDHCFPDLAGREPYLPEHLRAAAAEGAEKFAKHKRKRSPL